MSGYETDLPGMADAVRRLDDVTQQLTPVPPMLDGEHGDLGPEVTQATGELSARWAERLRAAQLESQGTLDAIRAARHHYRSSDEEASDLLRRATGDGPADGG